MSLPNANAIARLEKIKAERQSLSPSSLSASYLRDTPDDQVLSDPRALADIRDYYRKWKAAYFLRR